MTKQKYERKKRYYRNLIKTKCHVERNMKNWKINLLFLQNKIEFTALYDANSMIDTIQYIRCINVIENIAKFSSSIASRCNNHESLFRHIREYSVAF